MNFYKIPHTIFVASLTLLLIGCEVGSDYQAPDIPLPIDWVSDQNQSIKGEIDQQWWKNFNDPILTQLIDRATANNFDLKVAEARILEARATVAAADATLLPSGDIKGTATREANQLALPGGSSNPFTSLIHKPFNLYQTGFDASWELDLFGGNRRNEEAATAMLQAAEASRDDVRVSMLAEIARAYIAVRNNQARLAIAEDIVTSDKKTLDIIQQRFAAGEVPHLDVTQAEAILEEAQSNIPDVRNQITQEEYSLDVLLGTTPGTTHDIVRVPAPIPMPDKTLVIAAPAAIIAQRPDLRVAERKLAAATAQQGVALAKFFPDISLTGFFGALNTSTSQLINGVNESWLMSGSILWPILSYNSLAANLDTANAQQQEAMATYQKSVISALSDVERSLTAYAEQEKFLQSMHSEVEKDQRAQKVAEERYHAGATSRLEALEANRTLDAAQDRLIQAQADTAKNLIALYKSLGGGWINKVGLPKT